MTKFDEYRQILKKLEDWVPFLREESHLPGPRGNLELAHAVAQEGNRKQFDRFLSFPAEENTPEVFLVFCGVLGLGKLAAREPGLFEVLRQHASDPRWRVREAVATALQLAGDQDMDLLLNETNKWSNGNWYEKRAAAAGLSEPRLLKDPKHVKKVIRILDRITAAMEKTDDIHEESFKVLRQGMSYCWSVVVAALPEAGKPAFEQWLDSPSRDVRQMMQDNLKKNRLVRLDPDWVKACNRKLEQAA